MYIFPMFQVDNPVVFNHLVDQKNIESIIVCRTQVPYGTLINCFWQYGFVSLGIKLIETEIRIRLISVGTIPVPACNISCCHLFTHLGARLCTYLSARLFTYLSARLFTYLSARLFTYLSARLFTYLSARLFT